MIMAQQRGSGFDEVDRMPGRRPTLVSGAGEGLRHRPEELRSAFPIQTTQAPGPLTATFLGDAPIAAFAGAFLGCLTTECLSASGTIPCIASAWATALLCGLLLATRTTGLFAGAFFPALYGGTFAGMTPIFWLSDSATGALSVALSIVCGLVFFVVAELDSRSAAPIGTGCGGRLGAVAVVASFLFVELVRPLGADTSRFHAIAADAFDIEPSSAIRALFACLFGIFGTLLVLRQRRMAHGSVAVRIFIASAAALVGLIILHACSPDEVPPMDAFYAGCFLGMSTLDRLKGWFQTVSGAVVLVVLLVPVRAFLNGFGGGLGLAAFIAVVLLIGLSRATAWMMGNSSFTTAIASVTVAILLTIGLISAEPLVEQMPVPVDTTASGSIAELADATPVRMVVGRPAPGVADHPIPIGISLINAAADDVVVLSGLPSGLAMMNGRPSATGGWQLSASELANAAIRAEQGFVGGADIAVELRRADQSIIDRQQLHLEWAGPAPRAPTDVAAPLAARVSIGQIPDMQTEDDAALFREFLQSRGRAAPARSTRTVARGLHVRSQAATATGPHVSAVPLAGAAVRPLYPLGARADLSDRQKKPAPKGSPPAPREEARALRGP
jgi:hypothetical protein